MTHFRLVSYRKYWKTKTTVTFSVENCTENLTYPNDSWMDMCELKIYICNAKYVCRPTQYPSMRWATLLGVETLLGLEMARVAFKKWSQVRINLIGFPFDLHRFLGSKLTAVTTPSLFIKEYLKSFLAFECTYIHTYIRTFVWQ